MTKTEKYVVNVRITAICGEQNIIRLIKIELTEFYLFKLFSDFFLLFFDKFVRISFFFGFDIRTKLFCV